jgi:hypothetical protein
MRFPPKSYNKDLESAEDRREREAQVRFVPVQLFPPRGFLDNMHCIPVDTDPDPAFQVNPDPETIWIQGLMTKNQCALSYNVSFNHNAYLHFQNLWTLLSRVVKIQTSHNLFNVARGSQRDVVHLGWPIARSFMSPNAGGWGGLRGLSQWVQLYTWSPNKLCRSNSIFNLWMLVSRRNHSTRSKNYRLLGCYFIVFSFFI